MPKMLLFLTEQLTLLYEVIQAQQSGTYITDCILSYESISATSLFWLVYKDWFSQISYVKVCSSKV